MTAEEYQAQRTAAVQNNLICLVARLEGQLAERENKIAEQAAQLAAVLERATKAEQELAAFRSKNESH